MGASSSIPQRHHSLKSNKNVKNKKQITKTSNGTKHVRRGVSGSNNPGKYFFFAPQFAGQDILGEIDSLHPVYPRYDLKIYISIIFHPFHRYTTIYILLFLLVFFSVRGAPQTQSQN